jgi:putative nucleotidyltransferase with HDIG domain
MTAIALDTIMAKVKTLPGMQGNAAKLLDMLQDATVSAAQVEAQLRLDPGLTANLLRMANSAYFGFAGRIGSVRQAIVLLGSRRLMQLVVASCLGTVMGRGVQGYDLSPGQLWRHSIAVSVAAEALVRMLALPEAQEVFTAALLHDVGKIVLGRHVQEDLSNIEASAGAGVSFHLAERHVLGTDHAEVGARILTTWHLPEPIVDAVRWHHAPDDAERSSMLIDAVHVANVLCLMMGLGVGREGLRYEPSPHATRRLGLKPRQLETVSSQTLQSMQELASLFGG